LRESGERSRRVVISSFTTLRYFTHLGTRLSSERCTRCACLPFRAPRLLGVVPRPRLPKIPFSYFPSLHKNTGERLLQIRCSPFILSRSDRCDDVVTAHADRGPTICMPWPKVLLAGLSPRPAFRRPVNGSRRQGP
jgi:hypothetical protein